MTLYKPVSGEKHTTRRATMKKRVIPPPTNPPVISNVTASSITDVSATISWDISQNATGYVEYGVTTAYGNESVRETSLTYTHHQQTISSLTGSTTYHYRVRSSNANGEEAISGDFTFTTLASSGPGPTPSMYNNVYGPGIAADSRDNTPVDDRWASYRFIASQSQTVDSVTAIWRWKAPAPGTYHNGTGGTFHISIQSDSGGFPSDIDLSSVATFTPSAGDLALDDSRYKIHSFTTKPLLTNGVTYHVVFKNVDASPTANWTSLNGIVRAIGSTYGGTSIYGTAQPAYSDTLATCYKNPTWQVRTVTPAFKISYSNSTYDGQPYALSGCGTGAQTFGGTTIVRQRFTVTGGDKSATGLYARVKKLSGSGSLTLTLVSGGSTLETVTVPTSSFATLATGCNDNGPQWVGNVFVSPRTLTNGATYEVRMSVPSGTSFRLESPLMEEGAGNGTLDASHWKDRISNPEVSTNSGTSWSVIYGTFQNNMPFYFTLA